VVSVGAMARLLNAAPGQIQAALSVALWAGLRGAEVVAQGPTSTAGRISSARAGKAAKTLRDVLECSNLCALVRADDPRLAVPGRNPVSR